MKFKLEDESNYTLRISDLIPFIGLKNYQNRTRDYSKNNFEWLSQRSIDFATKSSNRTITLLLYNAFLVSSALTTGLAYYLMNN